MPWGSTGARLGDIRGIQWIRRSSAVVRWAFLVVACGLGAAAVIALAATAAATLVDGLS